MKSPAWQLKRSMVLERANYTCELCGAPHSTLHVHHTTYDRVGCELLSDLLAVCPDCHVSLHPELGLAPAGKAGEVDDELNPLRHPEM